MISKVDERCRWKNVSTEEGRKNYRRLRNGLKRATDNAKKEYVGNICHEIMEFQRTEQILKENGIDWRERRLISNLYMAESVTVRLNRGETRRVKIGRGVT